jgi:Tfp pilus assembly protein PilX
MSTSPQRGFTLITAVILSSVVLSLGIALLDVSYKQSILASSAKNSQYAFFAADSAMECALYYDQQQTGSGFDYTALPSNTISCSNVSINLTSSPNSTVQDVPSQTRTTTFDIPCSPAGSAPRAHVIVTKTSAAITNIYVTGYSSCVATDPRRIERGLTINY